MGNSGKSTISMAIFHSFLYSLPGRVCHLGRDYEPNPPGGFIAGGVLNIVELLTGA